MKAEQLNEVFSTIELVQQELISRHSNPEPADKELLNRWIEKLTGALTIISNGKKAERFNG